MHQRQLAEDLGGSFHTVVADDVAAAILDFAEGVNATHIVIGVSRHGRWTKLFGADISGTVARASEDIDVVLVTHAGAGRGTEMGLRRKRVLSRRRLAVAWLLALAGPPLVTALLALTRDSHALPTELLLLLTVAVAVALVGGLLPALVAAVSSGLLANWFFTEPLYTFTINEPENALALVVFVVVASATAIVVDLAARRTRRLPVPSPKRPRWAVSPARCSPGAPVSMTCSSRHGRHSVNGRPRCWCVVRTVIGRRCPPSAPTRRVIPTMQMPPPRPAPTKFLRCAGARWQRASSACSPHSRSRRSS